MVRVINPFIHGATSGIPGASADLELRLCPSISYTSLVSEALVDLGPNGYDGTQVGSVSVVSDTGSGGSYAFTLSGSGNAINHGDVLGSVIAGTGAQFMFAAWVKGTSTASNTIYGRYNTTAGIRQFLFRVRASVVDFVWYGALDASSYHRCEGTTNIADGNWHHVAVWYDGTQPVLTDRIVIYVDGVDDSAFLAASAGTPSEIQAGSTDWVTGNANPPFVQHSLSLPI